MAITTRFIDDNALAELISTKASFQVNTIDASDVLEWVNETFDPEDVFDEDKLAAWAENNDYFKDE